MRRHTAPCGLETSIRKLERRTRNLLSTLVRLQPAAYLSQLRHDLIHSLYAMNASPCSNIAGETHIAHESVSIASPPSPPSALFSNVVSSHSAIS